MTTMPSHAPIIVADSSQEHPDGRREGGITAAAFEEIFVRYHRQICAFIRHLLNTRDPEQVLDLAQDTFCKAYKALQHNAVVRPSNMSAWLHRIALNTTIDAVRKQRLITWIPLSSFSSDRGIGAGLPESAADSYQETQWRETGGPALIPTAADGRFEDRVAEREIIAQLFALLPEKSAQCLWLFDHDGYSCAEIAAMLQISTATVKMRLMRARRQSIAFYQQLSQD